MINVSYLDYKTILDKHKDDPNTLIYCDPPYLSKSQCHSEYIDGFRINDYEHLLSCLKSHKCKIIIHCDFNGFIYVEYSDYIKSVNSKRYNAQSNAKYVKRYQAILTNF